MFLKAGIILSIGEKFNTETLKSIPIDKILIESDESTTPIEEIYKKIATTLNISECELIKAVEKTYKNIFR